eukprot:s3172_g6.t1
MGLLGDAELLFRKALEASERTLGAEHPATWVSVGNLAGCLKDKGLLKDAEPLYRRALEASERTLGAEHPYTLVFAKNLAFCLKARDQLKDRNTTKGSLCGCFNMLTRNCIRTQVISITVFYRKVYGPCRHVEKRGLHREYVIQPRRHGGMGEVSRATTSFPAPATAELW